MYKIILIALALYLFCEALCHGFALFVSKIFKNADQLKQNLPEHNQFIQQFFYRTMLMITIVLMNHFFVEVTFYEQNDWVRFTWSLTVIIMILSILWWLNAWILQRVISNQSQQQSVTEVYKQKISYIMLHPLEFRYLYTHPDYLNHSVWLNRLLSLIALILAFVDTQLMFNTPHS